MSIVIITIPGDAHREFVNTVHRRTNSGVKLVIVQKPKQLSFIKRVILFCKKAGFPNIFLEAWYAILLRLNPEIKKALRYFHTPKDGSEEDYLPPVLWTDSVNSDPVHEALQRVSPDVLAVWGSAILEDRIIATAGVAINLHLGHSPEYRGALANQHAVLREDYRRVGATIHHIHSKVDGGDILKQLTLDLSKPPQESFGTLTREARKHFIEIVSKLEAGETLPVRAQEGRDSNVLLLRDWAPSLRYAVGKNVLNFEKGYTTRSSLQGDSLSSGI